MAFRQEKTEGGYDIVWDGFEKGIAASPISGIANIQNGNISTETGEIMASFGRTQASMTSSSATGTLAFVDSSHVSLSGIGNGKFKGTWIIVSNTTHGGELANGTYYVQLSTGGNFVLSASFTGAAISGYTAGLTATIALLRTMSKPIAYATEQYFVSGAPFNRYYVLDDQGLVWVYDDSNDFFPSDDIGYWFLPDTSISYWGSDAKPSGLVVLNGILIVMSGNKFWVKYTNTLGASYTQMTNAIMMSSANSSNPHFGLSGHAGRAYYTDGRYLGVIFPDTSLLTSTANNVQSYGSYVGGAIDSTIANLDSGTVPSTGADKSSAGFSGIPVVFYTAVGGTLPAAITANVVYYLAYATTVANFSVYDTLAHANAGGATGRINMAAGAVGTQYFTTFSVIGTHTGAYGDTPLVTFSPARLTLPVFEISQCLAEVGATVFVGCKGSVVYPWNQVDNSSGGLINIPESNVHSIITVNQMAYIFAGFKGNVYITDGSTASLVIKIPDYCAGIPGTPSSYVEPLFTWGGSAYVRGRVYFSVLDQTSTKAGNCGGIWSFVPTQNLYIGQDTGLALRQENQSSYATYNGYTTLIIPWADQSVGKAPQFWSCWQSALTSPAYGIDKALTTSLSPVVIDLDLTPVGTVLKKYTPSQIEYKLSAPATAGETVSISWRKNSTDAFTSLGSAILPDGSTGVSGYFNPNFQGAQWVQLQVTLGVATSPSGSFNRLTQVRMR